MKYSDRVSKLGNSITLAISAKAKAMKGRGLDVISLSAGQPDFPTPEHIKAAGIAAIEGNITGYTASSGTPALRVAAAEWMTRETGVEYSPDRILISTGAKYSLALTILTTVNPGEEVIFAAPYWVSYPEMVNLAEGVPVIVKTDFANGFKLTPAMLENNITDKTRVVLLNSPSNPTGSVYTKEETIALAKVLEKYPDIWIVSDEIYSRLIYGDTEHFSIAAVSPAIAARTIVVNGVSKTFAMTGWRIGWMAGPKEFIARAGKMQSHTTSCPSSISQHAAEKALTLPDDFLIEMEGAYLRRRDMFIELLKDIPEIEPFKPDGAFYLFCDIGSIIGKTTPEGKRINSSVDFADYLLEQALVAAVPGGAFGIEGYIRFSFAASDEAIERGVSRIAEAVRKLS